MNFDRICVGQPEFGQERVGAATGSARRGAPKDKSRGGSSNIGKPPGNTGLPLTLAGKSVRWCVGGNDAIRRWRRGGTWARVRKEVWEVRVSS
jgi:hypothetical protein